jgi:hypothetical protein
VKTKIPIFIKTKTMNGKLILLFFTAGFIFHSGHAQPGTRRQVGPSGIGYTTLFVASSAGTLFTIESRGGLYQTNPATAEYIQIGMANYSNTILLIAGEKNVFTIEKDGSLYRTNPVNGIWVRLGDAGAWAKSIAGTVMSGNIYTIQSNGALYATNVNTGVWKQVGKPEFANTQFLFNANDKLYTIEKDGSLYEINPADGSWKMIGLKGDWIYTIGGAMLNGKLYTIEQGGALYETNLSTGDWKKLGKSEFGNTKFVFAGIDKIYTVETNGNLYEIDVN